MRLDGRVDGSARFPAPKSPWVAVSDREGEAGEAPAEPAGEFLDQPRCGSAGASPTLSLKKAENQAARTLWRRSEAIKILILLVIAFGSPFKAHPI